MKLLRELFPISAGATSLTGLIIAIIVYVVVDAIAGVLFWILKAIPLVKIIVGLVASLFGLYTTVGIIVAILIFIKKIL